jgi:hypothetical protein
MYNLSPASEAIMEITKKARNFSPTCIWDQLGVCHSVSPSLCQQQISAWELKMISNTFLLDPFATQNKTHLKKSYLKSQFSLFLPLNK